MALIRVVSGPKPCKCCRILSSFLVFVIAVAGGGALLYGEGWRLNVIVYKVCANWEECQ